MTGTVFNGVHYCLASNLPKDIGQDLQKVLSSEGAIFHEDLDEQRPFAVTHMILSNMAADNFQKAISFIKKYPDLPLKLVKPEWVYDSIRSKGRLSEDMDKYSFMLLDTNITMANDHSEILSFFIPKNFFQNCIFYFYQYDQILFSSKDLDNIAPVHAITASPPHSPLFSSILLNSTNTQHPILSIIQQGKGKIVTEYNDQVTHIILPTQCSELAIRKTKKPVMATLFWLADAIKQCDQYMPLCHPLHFPRPSHGPIDGSMGTSPKVSITGYTGRDRQAIQSMLVLAGASFTGYFTNKHSVLIASVPQGEKYERATSWGIPIVNRIWIEDSYRQWKWQPLDDTRYSVIPITSIKQQQIQDEKENKPTTIVNQQPGANINDAPNPKRVKEASKKNLKPNPDQEITLSGHGPSKPFIPINIIIGYTGCRISEEDAISLSTIGRCRTSTNIDECTHLLANRIQRTEKFLKAIPLGLHIVSPNWLQDSIAMGKFLDEAPYMVKDPEMEEKYHFKLRDSIERAKKRKLFDSYTFQIAPGTNPQEHILSGLLKACGGQVEEVDKKKKAIRVVQTIDKKSSNTLDVESLMTSILTQISPFDK